MDTIWIPLRPGPPVDPARLEHVALDLDAAMVGDEDLEVLDALLGDEDVAVPAVGTHRPGRADPASAALAILWL